MNCRKLICLLLALVLAALCFAGCRGKKEEAGEVTVDVRPEEPQQIEVIDELPENSGGLEVEEDELVIEVPEGMEMGGD